MPMRLTLLYAVLCLIAFTSQAYAQAIIVDPDKLPPSIYSKVISNETLYVNGKYTHDLTKKMLRNHVNIGVYYKTLLAFTTLRLASKNQIKLYESISYTLPDILESNPFRVAITPHHILSETAGFAVPAQITDTPLKYYMTHIRTAGQMAHDDIVGWALLVKFLEAKSGLSIEELVLEEILKPIGLGQKALSFPDTKSPLVKLSDMTGSVAFIAEITRLLIHNRTREGHHFLLPDFYKLMVRQQSWRMHPLTPNHSYGGIFSWEQSQRWLEPSPNRLTGPSFMAFPEAGVAFIKLTGLTSEFRKTVTALAADMFLPIKNDTRLNDAKLLAPYERFNGYYVRADAPTAWLKDRLNTINNNQLHIREEMDGTLTVKEEHNNKITQYDPLISFHFQSTQGNRLTLSPYKSGGYLMRDGMLYRYIGILGNKLFVITLFPFVMIMLLSSGFYANSQTSKAWRNMGRFGVTGTLLICAGLLCDYLWWPLILFDWEMPLLINLWRALLNIGLMLVLSLPLFALSFVRQNSMPDGIALFFVPFHLALISIASMALFLILIAWGMAGEFSAY